MTTLRSSLPNYLPCVIFMTAIFLIHTWAFSQQRGSITGTVKDASTGEPVISLNVLIKGTSSGASTDNLGMYTIKNLDPGSYTLVFSGIGYETKEISGAEVREGETTTINAEVAQAAVSMAEVSVYGASLRRERITEAPAAVSVIETQDLKLNSNHGQLPRMLEKEPGVDIVQSGIQDFNINTRGFNSSLNRRLLVLMDGRDMAIAFLGAQEWNGLSIPIEDIARMELVRGPGSALYGPNAFNGVINIGTPAPKDILGTKISLSVGNLDMIRNDFRHADVIDENWSYKANIGRVQSLSWSQSRTAADTNAFGEFEYPGLKSNREIRPLHENAIVSTTYGSARVDYNFTSGGVALIEGGLSNVENELFVTGIGRVQVTKAQKPWGRLHYGSDRFNATFWTQGRNSREPQYSMASGAPLQEKSTIHHLEAQYNFFAMQDQLRVIFGASHRLYKVDTEGTLMAAPHNDNTSGAFAQVEYSPISWLKFVGAGRWDRSTLHKDEWSPKAGVVWTPIANHSLRATFNKAFQVPNYSEFFLRAAAGSANLPFFASPGNPSGTTPILARGNENLKVEHITGYEIGYKGIFLEDKLFLSVDGYYNQAKDFVTDLLQGVNPDYPFMLPPGFPAGLADLARSNVPGLTIVNGAPAIVVSYTNAGKVDERGVEFGFNYYVNDEIHFDGNWTWYDFKVKEQQSGDVLLPNAPKHKFGFGVTYRGKSGLDLNLTGRNVQPFRWAAGIFQGDVHAYSLLNFSGGYQLTPILRVSASVNNVFNHQTYQLFGGSLIGRQIIGTITATL